VRIDRPETVESLFIAFRLTGDPIWREYGWAIFQSIEKHCRVGTGGYAAILNVDAVESEKEDKMETFLLVCFLLCSLYFPVGNGLI
jgi:endoplasmic reticulum Man9GlcNAc2 1,2-alpha-mannosidase